LSRARNGTAGRIIGSGSAELDTRGPIRIGATGDRFGTECRGTRVARPVSIRRGPPCTLFMPLLPPVLPPPTAAPHVMPNALVPLQVLRTMPRQIPRCPAVCPGPGPPIPR
jgi:hypothetical protein